MSILIGVVPIIRNLRQVGPTNRNDADGRSPHRLDDETVPAIDNVGHPITVLAVVLPRVAEDGPLRVEKGVGQTERSRSSGAL